MADQPKAQEQKKYQEYITRILTYCQLTRQNMKTLEIAYLSIRFS